MSDAKTRSKPTGSGKPRSAPRPRQRKPRRSTPFDETSRDKVLREKKPRGKKASPLEAAASEVVAEAPPPEAVEPDPQLTAEQAEQARKKYLLTRFWISARGYWSRHGDRLAWPCTVGLLALICINVGFQ